MRPTDARDEAQESYSTAMPFERDGRTEILVFGADYLTAHDAETGKELWRWATYNPRKIHHWRTVPSPLVGDGLIYIVGPKHSTMFAIKPGTSGVVRDDHVAWRLEKLTPDVLIKGQDWAERGVVGREHVEAHGGKVVLLPLVDGVSTTHIIQRIREGSSP